MGGHGHASARTGLTLRGTGADPGHRGRPVRRQRADPGPRRAGRARRPAVPAARRRPTSGATRPTGSPRWPASSASSARRSSSGRTAWRSGPGRCGARVRDLRRPPDGPRRRRHRARRARRRALRRGLHLEDHAGVPAAVAAMVDGAAWRRRTEAASGTYDEDDVRVRPGRSSRPRTRTRPKHDEADDGFVVAVDRGRYTCARRRPRLVTAMRARELGRRGVVVGDRVGIVGDTSGRRGRPGPHRAHRRAHLGAAAHRGRRRHHRRGPPGTRHRGQRRAAGHRLLAGRPAAPDRLHRPVPGRRLRRRHRAAALPHQGRPGRARRACWTTTPSSTCRTCCAGPTGRSTTCVEALRDRVSVLVGHSGVGKSTLVNRLVPGRRPGGRRGQRDRQGPAHLDQRGGAAPLAGGAAGSSTRPACGRSASPTSTRTTCCTASPSWSRRRPRTARPTATTWAPAATAAWTRWSPRAAPTPRRLASFRRLLASQERHPRPPETRTRRQSAFQTAS